MDFRTKRQLTIVLILGAVGIAILFGFYEVAAPNPSCTDGRRNQGEEQVDCGGPCAPCALKQKRDLEVFWVRIVETRENTYDVVAEISNPNEKLGASRFEYEMKLFDSAGVAVATRRGVSYIYPRETIHIAEIGFTINRTVRNAAVTIREPSWILMDAKGLDVIAADRVYQLEDAEVGKRSVVTATLINRTLFDIPELEVTALVLDQAENLVGVHRTLVANLTAGERRPVRYTWPGAIAESARLILIEARSPMFFPASIP